MELSEVKKAFFFLAMAVSNKIETFLCMCVCVCVYIFIYLLKL